MTERFIKVASVLDLPESLKNVVQFQVVDGNVEAVIVTINDESVRIVVNGTYSNNLKVLKAEPKEEKKYYVVNGTVSGLRIIAQGFEKEDEADEFIRERSYSGAELTKEVISHFVDKVNI